MSVLILLASMTSLLHVTVAMTTAICPAVCSCDDSEADALRVDCSRAMLSVLIPVEDWPLNITHMDLSVNNITELDVELSQNTLQSLDLSHNRIRSVSQSAFGGLRTLQYLNLAGNGIGHFEESGFYGLEHLRSLNLSGNRLQTLPDKLFYNFLGLQELSLADNPLVHIDPIHFNRMISLRWLDVSSTGLYFLQPNIFHTTGQLRFLDISQNEFTQVPIDALRSAKSLEHLRVSGNPIDVLDKTSLVKLGSLEVLEVNFMDRLTEVKEKAFSDLTQLRKLDMRYCHKLTKIHPLAFEGLFNQSRPELQELDLEGNQLRRFQGDTVSCARMRKFNVQKNPWHCDCQLKWIKDCGIQKLYAADLKCASPPEAENALIIDLKDSDLTCGPSQSVRLQESLVHHEHVVRSISLGLAAGFLVVIAIGLGVLFKWKDIRTWYRNSKRGPGAVYYVRARANPREI